MKLFLIVTIAIVVLVLFFIFGCSSEGVQMFSQLLKNTAGSDILVTPLSDANNTAYCASCKGCSACCNVSCPNNSANSTCQENVTPNNQVVLAMNYNFPNGFPTTATSFISYWQDSSIGTYIPNRLYNKADNIFYFSFENCYLVSNENSSYTSVLQFYQNGDCSSPISNSEPMNICSGNPLDFIVLTTVGTSPYQIKNSIVQMSNNGSVTDIPSYPYGSGQNIIHTQYPQVSMCWCGYLGAQIYAQCPAFSNGCQNTNIKCAGLFNCTPESKLFVVNKQALYIPLMFYTKGVDTVSDIRVYRWITPLQYSDIGLQCYGKNNSFTSQVYYSEILTDSKYGDVGYFYILNLQNGPQTFTEGDIYSIYATFSNSSGYSTGVTVNFVVGDTSENTVFDWISSNPIDGLPNPNGTASPF
jgi:hypothetical protein